MILKVVVTPVPDPSERLPIHAAKGPFLAALGRGGPLVVTAPTGSGKSTCLPPWIADALDARVLVIEPRRVACRALAVFLARGVGERVGQRFGYRVRFDDRTSAATRVCFVTPGMALNLVASGHIEDYATVMLDEFHERSWELDLLVTLIRRLERGPQLIVCSATLAAAELVASLGASLVEAEGRSYPVDIAYIGDDAPSERELEGRVARAVESTLASGEGEVLVFLPGKGEIERCAIELERARIAAPVIPVHGGVPPDQLVDAFNPTGERRVFLATNVAESSLTLPGVRTVIDSGLARMRVHRGGHSVLALGIIARDSMDQRAGRAGRVAAGRCLRLWSSSFSPREVTAPEIERIELDDLVLRAAACGLDGAAFERGPWLVPPPSFALSAARERLGAIGALDDEGRVEPLGLRLARLPVSADQARILERPGATSRGLAGTLADLVALLEHRRPLWLRSVGPRVEEHRAELLAELGARQRDEVHAALLVLRRGDARRHGLHRAGLAEARRLADSLRALVDAPPLRDDRQAELPAAGALATYLLTCVPELAFVRRARADKQAQRGRRGRERRGAPWGNGEVEVEVRPAMLPGLADDERDPQPRAGLVLEREWLGVGRSARGRGRMVLPCSYAQLDAAGLGELELRDPKVEIKGGVVREIAAVVERRFAGVTLSKDLRPLTGAQLHAALADMILEGRKLRPLTRALAGRVADELHLWDLLAQVSKGPLQGQVPALAKPPEPRTWLVERLRELELDEACDLELLGDDDLSPRRAILDTLAAPIVALGERTWLPEVLATDFPRVWSDRDAHYGCTVQLERRRVSLAPLDALARKRGEPKPDLLPRFRGFRVSFEQASRRVVLRK